MKLVILDRDGVINLMGTDHVRSVSDWEPIPGSLEAIAKLTQSGTRVVVATNQSGVARNYFSLDSLNRIHRHMIQEIQHFGGRIDGVFYCPHGPSDDCPCRAPKPGLLQDLEQRWGSLVGVPFVGHQLRELQAAMAIGAQPILVRTGHGDNTQRLHRGLDNVPCYDNLESFVDQWLQSA